jgi:hypothetical protein
MTIIYDMANGTIQSEVTPESDGTDTTAMTGPVADLRLASVETTLELHGHDDPQTVIHSIRALLLSD